MVRNEEKIMSTRWIRCQNVVA